MVTCRFGVDLYWGIVVLHVRGKAVSGKVQGYIEEADGVQVCFDCNFQAIFFNPRRHKLKKVT